VLTAARGSRAEIAACLKWVAPRQMRADRAAYPASRVRMAEPSPRRRVRDRPDLRLHLNRLIARPALFAGLVRHRLIAVTVATAAIGLVITAIAAAVPAALLHRQPAAHLLAEE
jgi:hypothetical protein